MKDVIIKTLIIYAVAILLAMWPFRAAAFDDYDVNWVSNNSKESILIITIDGCDTKITVKNQDLEAFRKNASALTDAVKKAIERANNKCPKN